MYNVKRNQHNPILNPERMRAWEGDATFNWSGIKEGNTVHLVYRALEKHKRIEDKELEFSTIGYCKSTDKLSTLKDRRQLITPEYNWEKFGCEDPRIHKIGDTYYIFYTALGTFPFGPDGIKVALAKTKNLKDITEKHLLTPFNAKAMTLFPEKIKGKIAAFVSVDTDRPDRGVKLGYITFNSEADILSHEYWNSWYQNIQENQLHLARNSGEQIEVSAPPIKTKYGWLLIYSHIQNYFSNDRVFGVEAVLLDLKDPRKVIGRTQFPFLVPEEVYEEFGQVPAIVFPSGAYLDKEKGKDVVVLLYGATDTTGCAATIPLDELLVSLKNGTEQFIRSPKNPLIIPNELHLWEDVAVFNPAAVRIDGTTHIFYRAMGKENTSVIGLALSKDGVKIDRRFKDPIYIPRADFEKKAKEGNSGCEDPRATIIGDRLFLVYTAYDGIRPPGVAMTSVSIKKYTEAVSHMVKDIKGTVEVRIPWDEPVFVSLPNLDDKDALLFGEKFNKAWWMFHRVNHNVCFDILFGLQPEKLKSPDDLRKQNVKMHNVTPLFGPRRGMWDSKKVGVNCPPVKTKAGYLLLYHGIGEDHIYRVGAVLLDLNDPFSVIGRSSQPIFEPNAEYEKKGIIPNVVFPCGLVVEKDLLHIYYGGADTVVGMAGMSLKKLIEQLLA